MSEDLLKFFMLSKSFGNNGKKNRPLPAGELDFLLGYLPKPGESSVNPAGIPSFAVPADSRPDLRTMANPFDRELPSTKTTLIEQERLFYSQRLYDPADPSLSLSKSPFAPVEPAGNRSPHEEDPSSVFEWKLTDAKGSAVIFHGTRKEAQRKIDRLVRNAAVLRYRGWLVDGTQPDKENVARLPVFDWPQQDARGDFVPFRGTMLEARRELNRLTKNASTLRAPGRRVVRQPSKPVASCEGT